MFHFRDTSTFGDRDRAAYGNSGYELIAFDAEKLNVCGRGTLTAEPHWHPAPELITVLSGRFSLSSASKAWRWLRETCSTSTPRRRNSAACGSGREFAG